MKPEIDWKVDDEGNVMLIIHTWGTIHLSKHDLEIMARAIAAYEALGVMKDV